MTYIENEIFLNNEDINNLPKIIKGKYQRIKNAYKDKNYISASMDSKDILEFCIRIPSTILLLGISRYLVDNDIYIDSKEGIENAYAADVLRFLVSKETLGNGDWEVMARCFYTVTNLDKQIRALAANNNVYLCEDSKSLNYKNFNFGSLDVEQPLYEKTYNFLSELITIYWGKNDERVSSWRNKTLGHGVFTLDSDINKTNFNYILPIVNKVLKTFEKNLAYYEFSLDSDGKLYVSLKESNTRIDISNFIGGVIDETTNKIEINKIYDGYIKKKRGLLLNYKSGDKEPIKDIISLFTNISSRLKICTKDEITLMDSKIFKTDNVLKVDYDTIENRGVNQLHYNKVFGDYFVDVLQTNKKGIFLLQTESGMGKTSFLKSIRNITKENNEYLANQIHFQKSIFINIFIDMFTGKDENHFYNLVFNQFLNRFAISELSFMAYEVNQGNNIVEKKKIIKKFLEKYIKIIKSEYNPDSRVVIVFDGIDKIPNDVLEAWLLEDELPDDIYIIMLSNLDLREEVHISEKIPSLNVKKICYGEEYDVFLNDFRNKKFKEKQWQLWVNKHKSNNIAFLNLLSKISNVCSPKRIIGKLESYQDYYEYYFNELKYVNMEYAIKAKNILYALAVSNNGLTINEMAYLALDESKATYELLGLLIDLNGFLLQVKTDLGIAYVLRDEWKDIVVNDQNYNKFQETLFNRLNQIISEESLSYIENGIENNLVVRTQYLEQENNMDLDDTISLDNEFLLITVCLQIMYKTNNRLLVEKFGVNKDDNITFKYVSEIFNQFSQLFKSNMRWYKTVRLRNGMTSLVRFLFMDTEYRYFGKYEDKIVDLLAISLHCDNDEIKLNERNILDDITKTIKPQIIGTFEGYALYRVFLFSIITLFEDFQKPEVKKLNELYLYLKEYLSSDISLKMDTFEGKFDYYMVKIFNAYQATFYLEKYQELISICGYSKEVLDNVIEDAFKGLRNFNISEFVELYRLGKLDFMPTNTSIFLPVFFNAYKYYDAKFDYDLRDEVGSVFYYLFNNNFCSENTSCYVPICKTAIETGQMEIFNLFFGYIENKLNENININNESNKQDFLDNMMVSRWVNDLCELYLYKWSETGAIEYLKDADNLATLGYNNVYSILSNQKRDFHYFVTRDYHEISTLKLLIDFYLNKTIDASSYVKILAEDINNNKIDFVGLLRNKWFRRFIILLESYDEGDNYKYLTGPLKEDTSIINYIGFDAMICQKENTGYLLKKIYLDKERLELLMHRGVDGNQDNIIRENLKELENISNIENHKMVTNLYLDYKILQIRSLLKNNDYKGAKKEIENIFEDESLVYKISNYHRNVLKGLEKKIKSNTVGDRKGDSSTIKKVLGKIYNQIVRYLNIL